MNNRSRPPSLFPWPSYISGPHSSLTSAPRFPYDISGASSPSFGYPHGSPSHATTGYLGRPTSPPRAFRASPPPRVHVVSRLEYSKSPDRYSRYSASSPRRRFPDDDFIPENESVVVNAGFSFLMGKENSIIHKHVDIQPAHAIPEAPSSGLTRQIDKFLKKSDHTLDRYHNIVQSRSGGMVGSWRHRGKSMTPAGGREESPEPSSLGLSYRSQRSTSAASIAVKAEKHLECLKSGEKARKTATAPIAEHEEDQLDDDLSSSDSSLDGFDTDDDVPRSADVFDISDDTSADLSKLSAIEVDPTTNCSTPFDPSRLDDLSSDSDDEYFDVVQLPGLRPPQPSSTRTPSTSPLPDQQQPRPSEEDATQEPSHIPPAHSQSMPAVNKGISSCKMGNIQSYSPSTVIGTDTKQPVDTTQQLSHRSSADTANLANAINVLAPLSSTKSKPENSSSGDSKFKVKNTNNTERKLKKECSSGQEATIAGLITNTGSQQSSHLYCKDGKLDTPSTSLGVNLHTTAGMLKEESDVEMQKVANSDGKKENDCAKSVSQHESNARNILGTADALKSETKLDLGILPRSQNTGQDNLEPQKANQSNALLASTLRNERKSREPSKVETKPKEDLAVKTDLENMQKPVVTITSISNNTQKESLQEEYFTNKDEITSKVKIVSDFTTTPKDPSGKNAEENPNEEKSIDGKIGEEINKGKILETVNAFKAENSLKDQVVKEITKSKETQETVNKKKLEVMAKVETQKTKIAEVELIGDELKVLKPNDQTGTPRKLPPLSLRSNNKAEREITDDVISYEDGKDIGQKGVLKTKGLGEPDAFFKPICTFQGMPPSSPLHNQQEPSVKPKLGKAPCTKSQSSFCANTSVNSDNAKTTKSLSVSLSNEPASDSEKIEKETAHVLSGKRNDFNKKTPVVAGQFDTGNNAEGVEGKLLSSVEKPFNTVNESIHTSTSSNDKPSADVSVSSISKEPLVSVSETLLTKDICSSILDKKNTSAGSPASSENCSVDSRTMPNDSPLYKDGARNLKGISVGLSVNKDVTSISSSATADKTQEKSLPKQPAEQASQSVPSSHKVRLGSPVPNMKSGAGIKVTAPVVTGKLQITPNSGPGPPVSCKESTGLEEKDRDESDSAVSKKHIAEVPAVLNSKTNEENNAAENLSIIDDVAMGDEAIGTKTLNGVLEDCELRYVPKDKVQPTLPDQSLLQVNGIRIDDIADDKEDVDNDFSEMETFVDRSRCSSVASDTSRTISPDVSQRTGIRKPKGEKLSAMMNLWESEDASQLSEKSKMKQPPNKPKVGKISGIKNLFESGKATEKPEILNNPNLVKLRSASGAALVDPKSTPNLHRKIVPGASGIASMNAAKFGGTSKFKKPPECPPSAGDKILKKVKSNLSENDVKRNVSSQKEKSSIANNQKDLSNVSSQELKELADVTSSSDNIVSSNNQKNLDSVASANNQNVRGSDASPINQNDHGNVMSSGEIEKTVEKDKCLGNEGDTGIKEKPVKDAREVKLEKEENALKVENNMSFHNSKSAETKAPDINNTKCSKEVPSNISERDVGGKAVNVAHDAAESSLKCGDNMKKDIKKKKKKKKDTDSEDPDEKGKCQVDTSIVKVENLLDALDGKPSMVSCAAIESDGVKVACTKSEGSKIESNSDDSKARDITKESFSAGKDVSIDQGSSSTGEQSIDSFESKFKGSKTLGGIKSFIIESVAKGGKTLEDKLSKTGIPLGKKSAKPDYQKDSLMPDCRTKKRISAFDLKVSANAGSALSNNENIKPVEDLGKSKSDYKQAVMNCIPALESEVDALTKEASSLIEPVKTSHLPSYLVPKLELASKPLQSVASFPDTPMGGEFCVTSLPASPTEEKKNFEFVDRHKILSLPASPTKEVHFSFEETSEEEEVFVDAIDPGQLDTLMPLPDVRSERDIRSRSRTPMDYRERSVTPSPLIAESEAILSETDRLLRRSRSSKSLRRSYSRSLSNAALNRLSEVTADLSEEHTTAHLAGERLEAEQAERMKLEKEIDRLQTDVKRMTTANGKLEMEKLVLRSEVLSAAELNGDIDDDEAADASLYKRKYEWCLREIELLKKQSKQQQEDDLDQLLLLKKQLEKKVADAYEETDEQRQVVAQLKRKCQRLQAEMNDLKILLEEQTSRNNLLEKKQRKFDQEVMSVQEELRHERSNKDKIQRERDQILSEKYSFEQEVTTLKLELELKEEKVAALNRELDDLTSSGKVEEEVATLKKAKHDLELRIKDQEEELDDLAGQVQMLEGAKVRLEMSMEQMRKENRREISQREEELEEIRLSAQKKVKSLEAQLENEHEERTLLVREKHELERRITDLQDRTITHVDEDYVHKLKKELKKTKALLRDTQTMLEKAQSEGSHKLILRQLKTQLEDAEFAKTAALKARQCAESDLADVSSQLDEALRAKKESEDKCARVNKEKAEIQTQIEESEEELAEVMKKYKAVVSQLSVDQITLSEQSQQIAELEHSKQVLQERMMELSSKVEVLEGETANIHTQRRLEMKIKEIESKLELELTTRQRLESQIGRLKDQIERLSGECDAAKMKESQALDQSKRLTRQLRDAKEDLSNMQQRYTEAVNKKSELEKQLELSDAEVVTLKSDLKLAFKRIEDLQQAIQGDISDSDSELSDSDSDSDGSLSSYLTASLKHQRSSSNSTLRTPPSEVHQLERLELPNSPCSEAMSAISEDLDDTSNKESFA